MAKTQIQFTISIKLSLCGGFSDPPWSGTSVPFLGVTLLQAFISFTYCQVANTTDLCKVKSENFQSNWKNNNQGKYFKSNCYLEKVYILLRIQYAKIPELFSSGSLKLILWELYGYFSFFFVQNFIVDTGCPYGQRPQKRLVILGFGG